MPISITIRVSGALQAAEKLSQIGSRLDSDRGKPVLQAANEVAKVWRKNFDSEGGMVGGWERLAEQTQARRAYYGFNEQVPVLYRYGALRGVAVDSFADAKGDMSTSKRDNYSSQETSASLNISNGTAKLSAHGWKIANQWGYPAANGAGKTPARPFWFVDNNVIAAARKGVEDWLLSDVLR